MGTMVPTVCHLSPEGGGGRLWRPRCRHAQPGYGASPLSMSRASIASRTMSKSDSTARRMIYADCLDTHSFTVLLLVQPCIQVSCGSAQVATLSRAGCIFPLVTARCNR